MRVFSLGWNLSPSDPAENSAPLSSHLFVKMSLRLHGDSFSPRFSPP